MIAARFTFTICLLVSLSALTGCIAPDGTRFQPAELLEARRGATRQPDQDHMTQDRSREQGTSAAARPTSDRSGATGPFPARPILYFNWPDVPYTIGAIDNNGRALSLALDGTLLGWSPQGDRFAYLAWDTSTDSESSGSLSLGAFEGEVLQTQPLIDADLWYFAGWQSIWSPDGAKLALLLAQEGENEGEYDDLELAILEIESRRIVQRLSLPFASYTTEGRFPPNWTPYALRWSPHGDKVLLSWEQTLVFDLATATVDVVVNERALAEWLPDSESIVYFEAFGRPILAHKRLDASPPRELVSPETFAEWGLESGSPMHSPLLKRSPLDRYLAISGVGEQGAVLLIFDLHDTDLLNWTVPKARFDLGESWILALEWGPDGQELALLQLAFDDEALPSLTLNVLQWDGGDMRMLLKIADVSSVGDLQITGFFNMISWTR